MKLKYKILWIDDDTDAIERPKTQIKRYIEEDYGFECKDDDVIIKDYDEFENDYVYEENGKKTVKDSIKEFDLLLVDFDLGEEGLTGDILINIIRNKVYSEILFYSTNYSDLRSKLNTNDFMDGVFSSSRDELEEKTKKLINVTIKKVQDVNNLRGLIMAEVAELDILKEEIILKASEKISNKELEKYALKKIKDSGKSNHNKAESYLNNLHNTTFEDLFSKMGFVDSNKKALTVGEVMSKFNITEPLTKDTFTKYYISSILDMRNKFAHVKELNQMIADIPFTEEKCIEIRKEIRTYKKHLEDIKSQVCAN